MVNMKIDHFVVGPVQTNCYFVTNIKTKEMIIIDPGACAKQLAKKVDESGAKPVAILLTHGHFDHATDASRSQTATASRYISMRQTKPHSMTHSLMSAI